MNYLISILKYLWSIRTNVPILTKVGVGTLYFVAFCSIGVVAYYYISPLRSKLIIERKNIIKDEITCTILQKLDSIDKSGTQRHLLQMEQINTISEILGYQVYKDSIDDIKQYVRNEILASLIKSSNIKVDKSLELIELIYKNESSQPVTQSKKQYKIGIK